MVKSSSSSDLRFVSPTAKVKVGVGVQRYPCKLDIEVPSTCGHILVELESFLGWQLLLDYLVHGVLEALCGKLFHIAVDATVVLHQVSLGFVNALLLKVIVLMVMYPISAFVALGWLAPCEVLALCVWISFVVC